jgi:two-component system sensor histidine kinase QseC
VAERSKVRDKLANGIAGNLLLPLWFALPLLALLLWIAVTHGLRPLEKLASEVGQRKPDNLAALDASSAPREVVPLIERLNRLFARIDASMQKERRFTADAAHELRTPVAAIKAQAQVARAASGETERIHALDNAILGCDRAAHLIEQLLTLARVDTLGDGMTKPCQLRVIAAQVIAALAPAALRKGVQLELLAGDANSVPEVRGTPELLRILMRNLLDNSIQHTSTGTSVQVGITHESGNICLSVSDNGPGIPEQERAKVLERFYRPLGTQASGSGLGLSIVKRIAEVHHATLQLQPMNPVQGLRVTVLFKS